MLDDDRSAVGFTAVIAELPYEVLVLSNRIADHLADTLGLTLTSAIQLALADHIQFAIERLARGQRLENALLWELKSTYRREFTASLEIVEMVRKATGVVLPIDEAGFVTMHLVNAELSGNLTASLGTATVVGEIVALVRDRLGLPLATDSVAYARFLTHVKFAVQRIEEGRLLSGSDAMLYEMVRSQDELSHECALAVAALVRERYDVELSQEELLYLMVHIGRLRTRDDEDP